MCRYSPTRLRHSSRLMLHLCVSSETPSSLGSDDRSPCCLPLFSPSGESALCAGGSAALHQHGLCATVILQRKARFGQHRWAFWTGAGGTGANRLRCGPVGRELAPNLGSFLVGLPVRAGLGLLNGALVGRRSSGSAGAFLWGFLSLFSLWFRPWPTLELAGGPAGVVGIC